MARAKLDRERILEAALALLDEGGLRALTARALAARLDVTPMALYRHYPSTDAIVQAVFDEVVARADIAGHAAPSLDAWLVTTFARIRDALAPHPSLVGLLGTDATFGPSALRVVEATLARMRAAGLDEEAAVDAFHALLAFTIGAVAIEAGVAGRADADAPAALAGFASKRRFTRELCKLVRALVPTGC